MDNICKTLQMFLLESLDEKASGKIKYIIRQAKLSGAIIKHTSTACRHRINPALKITASSRYETIWIRTESFQKCILFIEYKII